MNNQQENQENIELNLASHLGTQQESSSQILTLYIPDKDRYNQEIGNQRKWVLEAADLLALIGGGVTIMPPTEGGWFDKENQIIIWEKPVLVYTYIKPEQFVKNLSRLRDFLHRMGRETNQGEIAVEFDGEFYRITKYDKAREKKNEAKS